MEAQKPKTASINDFREWDSRKELILARRFLLKIDPSTQKLTFLDFYVEQTKIASRIIVK